METFYVESSDPLSEVESFRSYEAAVKRAKEIATDLEADGFTIEHGLASRRNMYSFRATMKGARAITVQVNDEE